MVLGAELVTAKADAAAHPTPTTDVLKFMRVTVSIPIFQDDVIRHGILVYSVR